MLDGQEPIGKSSHWPKSLRMTHKKPHLPTKTCASCGRPFAWRRKWAKVWDEVRYCSDRCRREKTVRRG
ncbi:DUF2256 domain-containing protein [Nioella ostreopsis]|uniref:DUF2256 domain-containing protein n=1 Tax=Nioella ostreopsis TaxID=2448479 RepID=UPI0030B83CC6